MPRSDRSRWMRKAGPVTETKPTIIFRIQRCLVIAVIVTADDLAGVGAHPCWAQPQAVLIPATPGNSTPEAFRLTLDDARQRILANNKLLKLAALNVQGKG